jgi:hypothetical protein
VDGLHKIARSNGSWFPASVVDASLDAYDGPDLGWALFQLIVQSIDNRSGAKTGDVIATLAFLAGRVMQRATMRDHPDSFRLNVSANGVAFLRNDAVNAKLTALVAGTLASTLMESAMVAGARRFPEFAMVTQEASGAMQRRGVAELRSNTLSASPRELMGLVQEDIDSLLIDPSNRAMLVRAAIQACGHAVGYQRIRFCPAQAAELALSVALYGAWLDQREITRR